MDVFRKQPWRPLPLWWLLLLVQSATLIEANTLSKPYIPFRTSPFDQEGFVHHVIDFPPETVGRSRPSRPNSGISGSDDRCPLHFSLGISKKWHDHLDGPSINHPPTIRSVFPAAGPGKQVVYLTQYEHLDLLSPAFYEKAEGRAVQEALLQAPQFPMLWESSSFHSSPLLHDVNGDGIMDVIVADYDGGISVMGLAQEPGQGKSRYFHHAQVPRLHVRRNWVESRIFSEWNKTEDDQLDHTRDPYHSYFEYYVTDEHNGNKNEDLARGVTANVLQQDEATVKSLQDRRSRRVDHQNDFKPQILTVEEEDEPKKEEEGEQQQDEESGGEKKPEETGEQVVDVQGEPVVNEPEDKTKEGQTENQVVEQKEVVVESGHAAGGGEEVLTAKLPDLVVGQEQQGVVNGEQEAKKAKEEAPLLGQTEAEQPNFEEMMKQQMEERKRAEQEQTPTKATPQEDAGGEQTDAAAASGASAGGEEQQEEQAQKDQSAPQQQQQQPVQGQEEPKTSAETQPEQNQPQEQNAEQQTGGNEQAEAAAEVSPDQANTQPEAAADQQANTKPEEPQVAAVDETKQATPNDLVVEQQPQGENQAAAAVEEAAKPVEQQQQPQPQEGEQEQLQQGQQEEALTHRRLEEDVDMMEGMADDGLLMDGPPDDHTGDDMFTDDAAQPLPADDDYAPPDPPTDDYDYGREMMDDDYHRYHGYDDYYGRDYTHDDYYDDKHYIRIPPHVLSTPVLAEMPRLYGDNEVDDIMFVAASYFFDEDEYEGKFSYKRFSGGDHGDESEVKRGMYVANAILCYDFDSSGRWSSQTHLDLSTDHSAPENATLVGAVPIRTDTTEMGAFALASPTVADIDGDGTPDVLIGTSMGFLYAVEGRNLFKKDPWPIQMKYPIESRPVVEDVVGDTNLEIFVSDTGGNVACFSHDAKLLWNRDVVKSLDRHEVSGSSPLALGDVDGDGLLDVVITFEIDEQWVMFAFQAANGKDVANFPIELDRPKKTKVLHEEDDSRHSPLVQPTLVDLHSQQDHILDYIRRNTSTGRFYGERKVIAKSTEIPEGGQAHGLHIVQPLDKQLFIVEAGSGCTQKVVIGEEVTTMVQVDDIHGTNKLDLLVATEDGNVITLESSASFHPLNTWSGGSMRSRNSHTHGYSASQGVFVHEVSRQYRDVFGVYVPITLEIFDNRPNIKQEPDKKIYKIEIRDGSSPKRVVHRVEYKETGVFTERVYIRYGPGYYNLCVVMHTSHGIFYEDCFATGYNVHFMAGFGVMLWLPLIFAVSAIFLCGVKKGSWDEDDDDVDRESNSSLGILGRALPT